MYKETIERYIKICSAFEVLPDYVKSKVERQETLFEYINKILEYNYEKIITPEMTTVLLNRLNESSKESINEFLCDYSKCDINSAISEETKDKLFNLTLNTVLGIYPISPITYSDALKIHNKAHINVTDNGLMQCDELLSKSLFRLQVDFYIIEKDAQDIKICDQNCLNEFFFQENVTYSIIPSDYLTALNICDLVSETYWADFLDYAEKNNISATTDIVQVYQEFVQSVKLSFDAILFRPFRHICGIKTNILDYTKLGSIFNQLIQLDRTYITYKKDDLLALVLDKYCRETSLKNNDVIKIYNDSTNTYYKYAQENNKFTKLTGFEQPLFDEDLLWEIIRANAEKITTDNDNVYISDEVLTGLNSEQQEGLIELLRQQRYTLSKQQDTSGQTLKNVFEDLKKLQMSRQKNKEEE